MIVNVIEDDMNLIIKALKEYKGIIVAICICSLLILYNLDHSYLWHDEAQTSTISINTMKYGYPKVWDGVNLLTHLEGNDFNREFAYTAIPWLQFYVCGISLVIFGKTTFAARFPFAVFGIMTLFVVWRLAFVVFKNKKSADITALILSLYVPFLIYSRESRYYTLVFFFSATSTLYYMQLLYQKIKLKRRSIYLSISVILLFSSNYLAGGVWCVTAGLYALKNVKVSIWKRIAVPLIAGVVIVLPYIAYLFNSPGSEVKISKNFSIRFLVFAWKVQTYFLPIISILVIIIAVRILVLIINKKGVRRVFTKRSSFFPIFIAANVIVVSIPEFYILNHYMVSIVIAVPFVLTSIYNYFSRISINLSVIVILLCLFSNLLNVAPYLFMDKDLIKVRDRYTDIGTEESFVFSPDNKKTSIGIAASPYSNADFYIKPLSEFIKDIKIKSYFLMYIDEITHEYNAPNRAIVDILKKYGKPNEIVAVRGIEYETIIFYTGMKVANRMSEKAINSMFYSEMGNPQYKDLTKVPDDEIDWFILHNQGRPLCLDNENYIEENLDEFEIYTADSVDAYISNSPDLDIHNFTTQEEGKPFYILHRK